MSRVFPVWLRARSGAVRLALSCSAAALIAVSAAFPASAATIVNTSGQVGGISLVDTSANPGSTCKFTQPLVNFGQSPALTNIILSGPTVQPIVNSLKANTIDPAVVSVDFRVYQQLTVNGEPAGSRLVLSAVHQVLGTSASGTKVPDRIRCAQADERSLYSADRGDVQVDRSVRDVWLAHYPLRLLQEHAECVLAGSGWVRGASHRGWQRLLSHPARRLRGNCSSL